jgi:hypothetical protein
MEIEIETILSQMYILPFVKVTYDKWLNGRYEIIIGWLNKQIAISCSGK